MCGGYKVQNAAVDRADIKPSLLRVLGLFARGAPAGRNSAAIGPAYSRSIAIFREITTVSILFVTYSSTKCRNILV
jgi:hypothetical protein